MEQKIKLSIIAVAIILLTMLQNRSMAVSNCQSIQENNIKYVNTTLTKIDVEEYNSWQRGIDSNTYYALPNEQRYSLDLKSMLMDSTDVKCIGGIQNGYESCFQYGDSAGVVQGLVKNKLVNDNLYVIDKYTNKSTFFPTSNTNSKVYTEYLKNWKMPFIKEQNGYYSFYSNKYHVYRDYSTKTLKLHEGNKEGFYPFNNCEDDTFDRTKRKLCFTARMDIPFVMTKDGKVKNSLTGEYEDMVFNFSGDDDVWVFVDDKLVLDLGGCHMKLSGNINFAKNQVFYESIYHPDTKKYSTNINKTAFEGGKLGEGKHTLKIFYMERAGGGSNLYVTFNLQSGGIKANYIDKSTGKLLDTDSKSGAVGEKVTTSSKEIEGYTLIEKPETENYTLTQDLQTVNYYYAKNSKVIAKYLNEFNNEEIAQRILVNGKYGDKYKTNKKDIQNYEFTKVIGNETGTMKGEDIAITYYYRHKSKVTVNYIDKDTGEKIDTENKDVYEGENYTSEERKYEDYRLIEKPEKETVKIEKEDIVLNYYYQKLKFNLKIEMNLEKALINDNYYGLNGKLGKIETQIKDANKNSSMQIYYKVKVTNNQERVGSGYITLKIPKGYHILNEDWDTLQDKAKYKVQDLGIGEIREYEIVLEKSNGIDICGDIKTFIRIDSEKIEETTLEDNEDMNELAIMPRTGKILFPLLPIIGVLSTIVLILYKRIKR